MVIDRTTQTIAHDIFANIERYLPPRSLLVLNESKVIPARLLGKREHTGGQVEIFLLNQQGAASVYEVLLRPLKRLKNGDRIIFEGSDLIATILDRDKRWVQFNQEDVIAYCEEVGHIPLPPYIKREDNQADRHMYQTVFARNQGSVASPTAGLHFTDELLQTIAQKHAIEKVTLHINYSTFKPVEVEDITAHPMHSEHYHVDKDAFDRMTQAKKGGQKIVATGTTSCRVLEAIAAGGSLNDETDIFIYPGYTFQMIDALITNFHLPLSTLLMLVYAFGTPALMKQAYRDAIDLKYRFFSYGDGMLIL